MNNIIDKTSEKNAKLNKIRPKINDLNSGGITFFAPDEVCESVAVYNSLVREGYANTYRTNVADLFVEYGFKTEIVNGMWHIEP